MHPGQASGADAPPLTIPALREWSARSGSFSYCSAARIIVGPGDVTATARRLADDLQQATGRAPHVVTGPARAGDIVLDLAAEDRQLGTEGYRLQVGDHIRISANATAGLFYGTRTLLQLLSQGATLRRGVARDWPRYSERGLLVDTGRKHFSVAWLAEHIRTLGWLKLNRLHLHFTENLGWRIASDGHPEIVSEEHLTKEQVRQLLALADAHHVTVVPEIDLPGHMGAALLKHPDLQLRDAFGRANANNLDYTIPAARRFAFELIDEYVELFPAQSWHTGADEYLSTIPLAATPADYATYPQLSAYAKATYGPDATPKDGILGLLNTINARVQGHGKTLRVWNDGLAGGSAVTLDRSIEVGWWTDLNGRMPQELLAAGHRVFNLSWQPTYYINGFPGGFIPGWSNDIPFPNKPRDQDVYDGWAPHLFHGPLAYQGQTASPTIDVGVNEPHNLGSAIAIWNDDPAAATEQETAAGVAPRLRSLAQKTWGSRDPVSTYAEFLPLIARVGGPDQTFTAARVSCSQPTGSGRSPLAATGLDTGLWPVVPLLAVAALRYRDRGRASEDTESLGQEDG